MPDEVVTALSRPEVITALVSAILAILGAVATLGLWISKSIGKRLKSIDATVERTGAQVINDHGPYGKNDNLRDQIDRLEKSDERQHEILQSNAKAMESIAAQLDSQGKKIDILSGELRREMLAISDRVDDDRKTMMRLHED